MAIIDEVRIQREDALLDELESLNGESGALEARRARVLAQRLDLLLEEDPFPSPHHDIAVRSLVAELAAATHLSQTMIEGQMYRAHTLVHEFPAVLRALADGAITLRHADAIVRAAAALNGVSAEERAGYEARALDQALVDTPGRTEAAAKLIAAEITPKTVAERHRAARATRGVRARELDDGMGQASIVAPMHLIQAAFDRATEIAKQIIAQRSAFGPADKDAETGGPDTRTLDQIRADVMLELLIAARLDSVSGTPAQAITAAIQVTIPVAALTDAEALMSELDGFGPMLTDEAICLAAENPLWRRLFVAPDGMVVATDAYAPTAAMKRLLRARDQRCRFPGCRRPARRCQIDHNHDHAKGGKTEICNLSCFCTGHHSLKHPDLLDRHRWSVRQLPGGVIAWISPGGRTYIDEPPRRVCFT